MQYRQQQFDSPLRRSLVGLAAFVLLGSLLVSKTAADDRDLLRESGADPYLFIVLDTSASMNRLPECSAQDLADGVCTTPCDTGDCYSALGGDDPESKIYQAKQAIYEVIQAAEGVRFGLATLNQDTLRMQAKHWLYRVVSGSPAAPGTGNLYPPIGAERVFGRTWACQGNAIADIAGNSVFDGCRGDEPADVFTDSWEFERMNRYPMLGQFNNETTHLFIRDTDGARYRVIYTPVPGESYGSPSFRANVELASCSSSACNSFTPLGSQVVTFELIGEFYHHDFAAKRTEPMKGYFRENNQTLDANADARCLGLDPNTGGPTNITDPFNAENDPFEGVNLRFPTAPDHAARCEIAPWAYSEGDRLPQDWLPGHDHRVEISQRMAPNVVGDPFAVPDFGTSTYFNDLPVVGESILRLKNPAERPVISFTRTSLGRSIKNFRQWWQGCASRGNDCPADLSWAKIAAGDVPGCEGDPDWLCRRHVLLVISDSPPLDDGESDPFDGCQAAPTPADQPDFSNPDDMCGNIADLLQPRFTPVNSSIETFVISFGRGLSPAKQLQCMAREGSRDGAGTPFSARNKDELIAKLLKVLNMVREDRAAFASGSVPSVQAEATDKLFLTQFSPLDSNPRWDGHAFSFLKPVPLTDPPDRAPRLCARCDGSGCAVDADDEDGDGLFDAACLSWDAGEVLLTQAPDPVPDPDGDGPLLPDNTTVDLPLQHLDDAGTGLNERRIVYPLFHEQGTWNSSGDSRQLFDRTCPAGGPCNASRQSNAVRYDLWRALHTNLALVPDGTLDETTTPRESEVEAETNRIISDHLVKRNEEVTLSNGTILPVTYILGEIFHSDPTTIGEPSNVAFFVGDKESDGTDCDAGNPGYRCFFNRHQFRRKLLVMGSNDGMVHAFDAGRVHLINGATDVGFDDGTGKEVFAYMPRSVMPKVRQMAPPSTEHQFTVDGPVVAFDAFIDPVHSGTPADADREWRTIMIGGLREGGPAYYALDITHPDELEQRTLPDRGPTFVPKNDNVVPDCYRATGSSNPLNCHSEVRYPSPLWEFTDTETVTFTDPDGNDVLVAVERDEDANGLADLANAWSAPSLGVIRVCGSGGSDCAPGGSDIEEKYVAIFGGGVPGEFNRWGQSGNWLYMVDVETGEPIYKRQLLGSVPSEPAAVDTDSDGFLDRVYVGTTLGLLYRVDLTVDGSGQFPVLEAVNDIRDINGSLHNGSRVMAADWDPVAIFSATPNQLPTPIDPADITTPLPMFFRPSVLFVAELGKYAVAFGTGDREDLWRSTAAEGRFYLFVDDTDTSGATLPLFEDDLEEISPTGAVRADNLLLSPPAGNLRGWFMRLEPMERVVSDAFSVSGVTVFSSFQPTTGVGQITGSCANRGVNRLFGVSTTNANAILFALGNRTRFIVEETLVSQPFVEQGQTSNEGDSNLTADELQNLEDIMNELKTLFPPNCKFANYRLDIKAVRADTGLVHIAPVPICIVQKNWKEF